MSATSRFLKRALTVGMLSSGVFMLGAEQPISAAQDSGFRVNRMIEALSKGQEAISGDTWEFVDFEHSPYDALAVRKNVHELLAKKNAAGQPMAAPIVRIPAYGYELAGNRWMVRQALEAGAMGIISPKIDNVEQALILIQSMRFPQLKDSKYPKPNGERGGGGPGQLWGLKPPRDYATAADVWPLNPDGELLAFPMIESVEGVENLAAILDVPGVGGIVAGPNDLAATHGYAQTDYDNPAVVAVMQRIGAICKAKKKACATNPFKSLEREEQYRKMGFNIFIRTVHSPSY